MADPIIMLNFLQPVDGFMHSHYNGLNSIFSPKDIILMCQMFIQDRVKDTNNFFFALTSIEGSPYLIKVENVARFREFAQKIGGADSVSKENAQDFDDRYSGELNFPNAATNERNFLKMMNEQRIRGGFEIYRGNVDCNEWAKLSLSTDAMNNLTVETTLCF